MKKILEQMFIFFSKMYIYFHEDRKDYWRMFPILVLSFIFITNLEIISFYFIDVSVYYYVGLFAFCVIMFSISYANIKYEYVKNYSMTIKTKFLIASVIIIDLAANFVCLNILRNGKFMW